MHSTHTSCSTPVLCLAQIHEEIDQLSPISQLPAELMQLILKELSVRCLGVASSVNKRWGVVSQSAWKAHCLRNFFEEKVALSAECAFMSANPKAYYNLLETGSYNLEAKFEPSAAVTCMIAADDKLILGEVDGTIQAYAFTSGAMTEFNRQHHMVTCLISQDKFLISGYMDGCMELYDSNDFHPCSSFQIPGTYATSCELEGHLLSIGCEDGSVYIYNLDLEILSSTQLFHGKDAIGSIDDIIDPQKIVSCSFSNNRMIMAAKDGEVMIEDFKTSETLTVMHLYGILNGIHEKDNLLITHSTRSNDEISGCVEKIVCVRDLENEECYNDFEEEDYYHRFKISIDPQKKNFSVKEKIFAADHASERSCLDRASMNKQIYKIEDISTQAICNGHEIISVVNNFIDIWSSSSSLKHKQSLGSFVSLTSDVHLMEREARIESRGRHLCLAREGEKVQIWKKMPARLLVV